MAAPALSFVLRAVGKELLQAAVSSAASSAKDLATGAGGNPEVWVDVKSELPQAVRWTNEHTKQMAYSVAQAMNAAVMGGKYVSGSRQDNVFTALEIAAIDELDRPKPAIRKGFRADAANKRNLQVLIKPKNKPWDRNPYLAGVAYGMSRTAPKPYEVAFMRHPRAHHTMPRTGRLVPTGAAKPDRYGNVSKRKIQILLASVGRTDGRFNNVFIGRPKGATDRKPGVYMRLPTSPPVLIPYFRHQTMVSYKVDLEAADVITDTFNKRFGPLFRQELKRNVAKRRLAGKADLRTGLLY